MACTVDLAPTQGPREVFFRKSEATRGILLACQDCRRVLPDAWIPAVLDKLDEESLRLEPTGPEAVLSLDLAQAVMSDTSLEQDALASSSVEPTGVPVSVFTVQMKGADLHLVLGDAIDKARCGMRSGSIILPGDLCLKVDGVALKEGDVVRGLRVVRDPDIIAKDTPFAYVADPEPVRREGRLAMVRFRQPKKNVKHSFVRKFFVSESERRFILSLIGENKRGQ
jgi:hypothetical protein